MSVAHQPLTLEQFLKLPETQPAREFQTGRVTSKPMPQGKHSRLQLKFATHLGRPLEEQAKGMFFPELRSTFAGRSIVPDVAYFLWNRIPRDADGNISDQFALPPDLSIEILSPKQDPRVLAEKLTFCVSNGCRLGLLVDPYGETVTLFRPDCPAEVLHHGPVSLEPVIAGLTVTVEEIFGWLK